MWLKYHDTHQDTFIRFIIVNTLRPRKNGRHSADNIFIVIFFNENFCSLIQMSWKFVPTGQIASKPALFQLMAWCQPHKPLSEPTMDLFTDVYIYLSASMSTWIQQTIQILNLSTIKYFDKYWYLFPSIIRIGLLHKSHNAPVPCPTMDICLMHSGICELGLFDTKMAQIVETHSQGRIQLDINSNSNLCLPMTLQSQKNQQV